MFKDNRSQTPRTEKDHRAICPYFANAVIKVESILGSLTKYWKITRNDIYFVELNRIFHNNDICFVGLNRVGYKQLDMVNLREPIAVDI